MTRSNWPDLLAALLAKTDLTSGNAAWAMGKIMRGEATGAQIAAFAVALRAKGETAAEVTGMSDEMLAHSRPLNVEGPLLDIVGTGGDLAHTVNISTMAAIVAAAAGARVGKHGNRASTSECGSADVLEALGVAIDLPPDGVARSIDELGIGFCFAPVFHPAMRFAGPTRREIGVPTVFNILGPLSNPARPQAMSVGCANQTLAPVMAKVLADRQTCALVVRGMDGLDEVTIFDETEVWSALDPPQIVHGAFKLSTLDIASPDALALRGGDAHVNARILREVLAGGTTGNLRGVRDAVALNAASALVAWASATGGPVVEDITEAITAFMPAAYEAIDSGASTQLLDRWIVHSQEAR